MEVGAAAGDDGAEDAHAVAGFVVDFFRGDAALELDGEAIEDVLDFTIPRGVVGGDHAEFEFAVLVSGDVFFEVLAGEGGDVGLVGEGGGFVEAFFGEAGVGELVLREVHRDGEGDDGEEDGGEGAVAISVVVVAFSAV